MIQIARWGTRFACRLDIQNANLRKAHQGCTPSAERDYPTLRFSAPKNETLFLPREADHGHKKE